MARREAISEHEKLDVKLARELVIDSFRLSQGDPDLQVRLIRLMFYLNPQWRMARGSSEYQKIEAHLKDPRVLDAVHRFRVGPAHLATHDPKDIATSFLLEETESGWMEGGVIPFLGCLSGNYDRPSLSTKKILKELILADLFFFRMAKRMDEDRNERESSFLRQNSFIADFVISDTLRRGLRTQAFKKLCSSLEKRITALRLTKEDWHNLQEIQNRHNAHPSNTKVDFFKAFKKPPKE